MDILAISYHNIGPFRAKTLSVIFHHGKYLIQAAIGSGKSFLFFDGPIYGLYKYSTRRMLNIEEKKGFIKLLFVHHEQLYLIVRDMSAAKAKDTCKSRLFLIPDQQRVQDVLMEHRDTLYEGLDIQSVLQEASIPMEELSFKNETDVQQNLDQLLPPREVFVSTVFMMQDSANIFELTPTERLLVLKNVFNLMDIDQAKDRIADRKRQIQTEKKILSDTTQMDVKLQSYVDTLLTTIASMLAVHLDLGDMQAMRDFYDEVQLVRDKISIMGFDLGARDDVIVTHIREKLEQYQREESILLHQKETSDLEIQKITAQKSSLSQELHTISVTFSDCQKEIDALQAISLEDLHKQEQALQEQEHAIRNAVDHQRINTFAGSIFSDWHTMYRYITDVINEGKVLAESQKSYELQKTQLIQSLADIEQDEKHILLESGTVWYDKMQRAGAQVLSRTQSELSLVRQQYEHTLGLQKEYQEELTRLEQSLHTILHGDDSRVQQCLAEIRGFLSMDDASAEKIASILANYIGGEQIHIIHDRIQALHTKINDIHVSDTLSVLGQKIADLEKMSIALSTHIQDHIPDFMHEWELAKQDLMQKKKTILQRIEALATDSNQNIQQARIDAIKDFLLTIQWKKIQESYGQYQTIHTQREKIQEDIRNIQDRQQQRTALEHKKTELQTRIDLITKQSEELDKDGQELQSKQKDIEESLARYPRALIHEAVQYLQTIQSSVERIRYLISDYAHNKIKVKSLLEQEEVVNNLYTIFSKELLLLVLSESLPLLAEIINVFLAQVVPFQLQMRVIGEDDKLELEAIISDSHGSREVKSLSGGQRVILKLVWMLALSSFMRSPLLFLDETINNLDKDTVGIVADMLADFIKKNDIKLYTITHSEQIQAMGIWDGVVQL